MSIVVERYLDLVQSVWLNLNNLVPLGIITCNRDYNDRVRMMNELHGRVGANESHMLLPLLELVSKDIERYEAKNNSRTDAPAAMARPSYGRT
jgi:hypothetical protein